MTKESTMLTDFRDDDGEKCGVDRLLYQAIAANNLGVEVSTESSSFTDLAEEYITASGESCRNSLM